MTASPIFALSVAQRDLVRRYIQVQTSLALSENNESERRCQDQRSENANADRNRTAVETCRQSALQQADVKRQQATAVLDETLSIQTQADSLVNLLRRRGDLPQALAPIEPTGHVTDAEQALIQCVQVAREA